MLPRGGAEIVLSIAQHREVFSKILDGILAALRCKDDR